MHDPDAELVRRAGLGDARAAESLVRAHIGRVLGLARRILGDAAEAEDVAQEVFLRLWRHAPRWRSGGARLTTWLHAVALNLCRDRLARRRETLVDDPPEVPDPRPSPAGAVEQQEIGHHVSRALLTLPPQQRAAIALCHYQGLRNTEAAEALGVSVAALESLLARGRRTLREQLRDLLGEG